MRAAWFGLAILVLPSTVLAQPTDVEALADQLANAKDFRVRTQAALALGASKSKGAVEPLCSGLGDENSTVRAASAAALGKLRKGGRECLKRQLVAESKESVKSVIERSIARLDAGAAPLITERTMFFVALEVIDDTGRGGDAVSQQFRSAVARAVAAMPEFAIAPREQSRDEAKSLLALHPKVTGFLLSAKIKAQYAGGALTVKIETAIFTYPDRNLLGTFSRTLSMQGVTGVDRAAEDELIRTGAARSMETFAPMAQKLR